jgi:hypothetical protein
MSRPGAAERGIQPADEPPEGAAEQAAIAALSRRFSGYSPPSPPYGVVVIKYPLMPVPPST